MGRSDWLLVGGIVVIWAVVGTLMYLRHRAHRRLMAEYEATMAEFDKAFAKLLAEGPRAELPAAEPPMHPMGEGKGNEGNGNRRVH